MATTYAQRLTEVDTLQRAGLGLVAVTNPDEDILIVKDPDHAIGTAGGKTPAAGQLGTETWVRWAGGDAQAAYGL